ncbi:hypothetical protein L2W58_08255 [Dethiosulfovibrio sp. F2B]|uniref:hypothetical protein n=1 Tax=Dethiosulfovibrio faecalis TaxID=2720018 RepID=UPI001F4180FB|nr:hypothetical protein [Dethiosulfovibrio faecalis]MCF4151794.1 hypothetical protein [Dethiosulfovibrio faecalis]
MQTSNIISTVALVMSGISLYFSYRSYKLNNEKELRILASSQKANIRGEIISEYSQSGSKNYKALIWNDGKATAREITVDDIKEKGSLLTQKEINDAFPVESLEPDGQVRMPVCVFLGSTLKQKITIRWSDDFKEKNEKNIYLRVQ